MFSLPYLISQLYPHKSKEDLQKLADACLELNGYYTDTWLSEDNKNLEDENFQLQLAKTLFNSQLDGSERGVIIAILDFLEEKSDNGSAAFPDLPEELQIFYEHFYAFAGFMHFDMMGINRQSFLLRSRFLVWACIWDVPVYINVQNYFANIVWLKSIKEDAAIFMSSIAANDTPIGTPQKLIKTVAEWVDLFENFKFSDTTTWVDDFIDSSMEVNRLDAEDKEALRTIITLYWGIRGGYIWREVQETETGGYKQKTEREGKTVDEKYLDLLSQGEPEQFTTWLADYENIAQWIRVTDKTPEYIQSMLQIIYRKIDLKNTEQAQNFVQLLGALQERGLTELNDLVYFDEQNQTFEWNEEAVEALGLKDEESWLELKKIEKRIAAEQAPEEEEEKGKKPPTDLGEEFTTGKQIYVP